MTTPSILVSPEEFADEVEAKLGRANGNVWQRIPGIEGQNDGQIMVRLKKKRYVVLDYTAQPTEADMQLAAANPHIKIPKGAGTAVCKTAECQKVGVPICIYDSEPAEPDSLYLRSGLCFLCQRNLNEKRRTERKRSSNSANPHHAGVVGSGIAVGKHPLQHDAGSPSLIYAIGPASKKFKFKHGGTIELESDAVIVNGSVDGTRHYGEGYGFQEIGVDLLNLSREAALDTEHLVHTVSSTAATAAAAVAAVGETASSAEAAASSVVVDHPHHDGATPPAPTDGLLDDPTNPHAPPPAVHHHHHPANGGAADGAAVAAAGSTSEDINVLYNKAFQSLNKSIFLLTQWKASWDSAIAAAHETVADPSLADAVASAAAVVAAAATDGGGPGDQNSANMVSLLLAADKRKEGEHHHDVHHHNGGVVGVSDVGGVGVHDPHHHHDPHVGVVGTEQHHHHHHSVVHDGDEPVVEFGV